MKNKPLNIKEEMLDELQEIMVEYNRESQPLQFIEQETYDKICNHLSNSLNRIEKAVREETRDKLSENMEFASGCDQCGKNLSVLWPPFDPETENSLGEQKESKE